MKPLSILITRAMPEAEDVAEKLIALGHHPILAPLQQAEAVLSPLPYDKPDRLIATSARAFRYGTPIPDDWRNLPLHVVGKATAHAAQEAGFSQLYIAQGEALSLLENMHAQAHRRERLLYLAGEPRRPEIEAGVQAAGYSLSTHIRYRMIGVQALPDHAREALRTGQCDAILHFSALSAALMIRLARQAELLGKLAQLSHLCFSHAIAQMVEAEMTPQKTRILCAKKPDLPNLLDLLISVKA